MKSSKNVPSDRDMQAIPRWARVALAARTLRRIQPLLLASWPKATRKYRQGVEWAIAEGERAAAQGRSTPDLQEAGMAAMDVYGSEPMDATTANFLTFAASRVSFGGQQRNASDAQLSLKDALLAVSCFEEEHAAPGVKKASLEGIWADFQELKESSKREKWTDNTPVNPDSFGPMWPNGLPRSWPTVAVTKPVTVARRSRPRPPVAELGLPADLIAFLRDGRQLAFDHRVTNIGPISLKQLDHLRFDELPVITEGTPQESKDPHHGENGHYILRVVDLIGESELYSPEGLLAWFPDYRTFGSWDADHLTAISFPRVSWSKIVAAPVKYLDAQWDPHSKTAKYIEPWRHCSFKEA
jgi:hypothetical protein